MNVLFCNIAWMKYYNGVTEDDKPKNGGKYVKENEYGNECFNFQDYNGKCYGFVMLYGDMNLEAHFKDANKHAPFMKDMLVVWVATNDSNETRIVGWNKNATVYRTEQCKYAFTNDEFELCYNIEADVKDCCLLPEEERNFKIQRAAQSGRGTGMGRANVWYAESSYAKKNIIPNVIDYIDNYKGKFANTVYTDEILGEIIKDGKLINDFQRLYDEGMKYFDADDYMSALKLFNTARLIKETPVVLLHIADCLFAINRFDRAIPLYKKVIEFEGNNLDTVGRLVNCYDYIGDRKETIKYCNLLISLIDDSKDDINEKVYYNCVIFDIYVSLEDENNARMIIDRISKYSDDDEVKKCIDGMQNIIKSEFEDNLK